MGTLYHNLHIILSALEICYEHFFLVHWTGFFDADTDISIWELTKYTSR